MNDVPQYPPVPAPELKKKEEQDPVARSIAKPHAFAKAGTDKPSSPTKGTRFRPMQYKRPPGRPRKKPRDPRKVDFY